MIHNNAANPILGLTIVLFSLAATVPVAVAREPDVPFTQLTIDAHPPSKPYYKMVGDINGDLDIIGANHAGVHPLEMWKNGTRQ